MKYVSSSLCLKIKVGCPILFEISALSAAIIILLSRTWTICYPFQTEIGNYEDRTAGNTKLKGDIVGIGHIGHCPLRPHQAHACKF
jgi:hypothetical protein